MDKPATTKHPGLTPSGDNGAKHLSNRVVKSKDPHSHLSDAQATNTSVQKCDRLEVLTPSFRDRDEAVPQVPARKAKQKLPHIDAQQHNHGILYDVITGFKTWGTSFFVHLILIIVLGLISYQLVQNPKIGLTMDDDPIELLEEMDVEANFNFEPVEDESDFERATEFSESEPLVTDDFDLSQWEPDLENTDTDELISTSLLNDLAQKGVPGKNDEGGKESIGKASFYGIEAEGKSFVFVVDRSGSMLGEPWLEARAELLRSIDALNDEQEFFLILFNHESHPVLGRRGRRAKLSQADDAEVRRTARWIQRQIPDGGTLPKSSIKQALRLEPDVIFLLSDGVFRDGTLEYLREHNARQSQLYGRKRTVVHTIAFKDPVGRLLLQQIAAENGGVFKFVN